MSSELNNFQPFYSLYYVIFKNIVFILISRNANVLILGKVWYFYRKSLALTEKGSGTVSRKDVESAKL